jgi:pimeloyl-ACP methyl ester carboxylesterase
VIFLLGFLVVYLLICLSLARGYICPIRLNSDRPSELMDITFPAKGGTIEVAWCTKGFASKDLSDVVFVFAHGYGGGRWSFAAAMVELQKLGIDAIAPAMPGQDSSPRKRVGFGVSEAELLVEAADFIRTTKPEVAIIYAGVSMGGAAAWLASERDPKAQGVFSEGAYARFDQAVVSWFNGIAPGGSIYLRPVVWFASWMSGIKPSSIVPVQSAAKWKGKPALVIQAELDRLIPLTHAEALAAASGAELWVTPSARHSWCYEADPQGYLQHVIQLVEIVQATLALP